MVSFPIDMSSTVSPSLFEKRHFKHTVGTIDEACDVPVPFFKKIENVLKKHGITGALSHQAVSRPGSPGNDCKVYVLPNLTVVYTRERACLTPPGEMKSYDADSYDNTADLALFSRDAELLKTILADLNKVRSQY